MNSAACLFQTQTFTKSGCPGSEDHYARHTERLNAVFRGWGFETLRTEGDGNCFFSSVAIALSKIMEDLSSETMITLLESNGIHVDMTIPVIAKRLRELLVKEWLNHSDRYQPFLSSSVERLRYFCSLVILWENWEIQCLSPYLTYYYLPL